MIGRWVAVLVAALALASCRAPQPRPAPPSEQRVLISLVNEQLLFGYSLTVFSDGRVVYRGRGLSRGAAAWELTASDLEGIEALFHQSGFLQWPAEQESGVADVSLASLSFDDGQKRELRYFPIRMIASDRVCGLTARLFEILDVTHWTPLTAEHACG